MTRGWMSVIGVGVVVIAAGTMLGAGQGQTVLDGLYTDAQAIRGAALYRDRCEGCHAPDLSGGKVVPGLAGPAFAERWSDRTLAQWLELVLVSMPEEDPGSVSASQSADILAFILRANGLPAGDSELPSRPDTLERYTFAASAP